MFKDNLLIRYEPYVAAGVIACHVHRRAEGFRQRDLLFYIGLFSNWGEALLGAAVLPVKATQIQRYVNGLCDDGFARLKPGKRPRYHLSRLGVVELLERMRRGAVGAKPELFYFTYYFFTTYSERLQVEISREGSQYPPALKHDIEALLNTKTFLQEVLSDVEQRRVQLDTRINEARAARELVRQQRARQIGLAEIIASVEKKYPYELNSEKPLGELLSPLPEAEQAWEIEAGTMARIDNFWVPARDYLKSYAARLQALLEVT